ncbi:MAG: hypothetical protein CM15mV89_0550 [Caudoviricetes sp.]|nr:MAG: hypothetical protein CM15mV89_0550 [Caudoviricetes sp.]
MIPLLISASALLNFVFYIYAIGFVIALGLEQYLKFRPLTPSTTERETHVYCTDKQEVPMERDMGCQHQLVRM